jgi:hypothetical protein
LAETKSNRTEEECEAALKKIERLSASRPDAGGHPETIISWIDARDAFNQIEVFIDGDDLQINCYAQPTISNGPQDPNCQGCR